MLFPKLFAVTCIKRVLFKPGGPQSFQKSRSHLETLGARKMTLSKFSTEDI